MTTLLPIRKNVSLKPYNTFGMDVRAQQFIEINSALTLQPLLRAAEWQTTPKLILGGGSNILLTQDFPGLVIKIAIPGFTILKQDNEHVWLKIGAGENWHNTVLHCVQQNWGGVENLSLIPGTVGAAPIQNIGAYGVELKEVFQELSAIALNDGERHTFNHAECQFGYRDSIFKNQYKNKYVIESVTLKLNKKPNLNTSYGLIQEMLKTMHAQPSVKTISDAVIKIRQSKLPDPAVIGNAGSFFKNPEISPEQLQQLQMQFPEIPHFNTQTHKVKIPAAWLIEQCGFKGKRFGNIGVHEKQALVLVNYGSGKGDDIKTLSEQIQAAVLQKFSIALQTEVNIL